jgi:ubiquinone/menaquinone biosynthesis C-methylase UbiE
MPGLLAAARRNGCRAALEAYLLPATDAYTLEYAWDERRADWYPLCNLPASPVIVDLGAGWGAVSMALARLEGQVFAVDSNIETLNFISIRAAENQFNNVECVRVDPIGTAPLPFADNLADLVVMNGVLEWVGMEPERCDPAAIQKRALQEVSRILKPGGSLYLGIESRYGLSYWLGKQDHRGTRFTSVLPRWLASCVTRAKGMGTYRTYTHSRRMLQKIILKSGFRATTFYSPFPDYRSPLRVIPIEDGRIMRASLKAAGISLRHALVLALASYLGIHRNLVENYSVVAQK